MPGGVVKIGGFSDVEQAWLRTSLFGEGNTVALKKLRPSGDSRLRLRVMAVRTVKGKVYMADLPLIVIGAGAACLESAKPPQHPTSHGILL